MKNNNELHTATKNPLTSKIFREEIFKNKDSHEQYEPRPSGYVRLPHQKPGCLLQQLKGKKMKSTKSKLMLFFLKGFAGS